MTDGDPTLRIAVCATALPSLALAIGVATGWIERADRGLLSALHARRQSPAGKPTRLGTAARDLTALGGDTLRILFLAGCMAGLLAARRPAAAWQLLAIFASARLALYLLKAAVRRPRPDAVVHGVVTFTSSFPSGHTFMATSLFLAAALLVPAGEAAAVREVAVAGAIAVSLGIATTRLGLGIHWPSDVAVGWLAGAAWAMSAALLIG